jgi:membrane protein implicated in regulation of membrane protease activity
MFSAWLIWIAIGIVCVIIEIFTPGFLFLSFGFGAIVAGLSALAFQTVWFHVLIFAISSFLFFITTKKWSAKLFKESEAASNIFALEGMTAKVTKSLKKGEKGFVKVQGEVWSAVCQIQDVEVDELVIVKTVEGNKLIVEKL